MRDSRGMSDSTLDARGRDSATRVVSDVFAKARDPRPRRAARSRQAGRPPPLLPDPRVPGGARGGDGGTRDDHARLQQLPGADHGRAGQAGGPRRPGALRHRRHRLAPAQRHHAPPRGAGARARRLDGDRGRDRLHDRLPVEPGRDQRHPRARRHRDLRLGRPRLDPRRLQALRRPPAALPPQPDGQAGDDAGAGRSPTRAGRWWWSTASSRWRATSATCRRSSSFAGASGRG